MDDQSFYENERQSMVNKQIAPRNITDPRVLNALRTVPRHLFVPEEYRHLAYADGPLPIDRNQTISQPYIVALMTELLCLTGDEKVLEIGTGSGYQAAILGKLVRQVYTIERHAALAEQAALTLKKLGYSNVYVLTGDGSKGLPAHGPYDSIIITAAAPRVSQDMLEQLVEGGILVVPVGGERGQVLQRWIRQPEQVVESGDFVQEKIVPVAFVPMRGRSGWKTDEWGR
ncbi:MAG: protein-L-isoaspartate(D-aspartate) O-methyltransferase [Anaerolineales bacterium]